MGIEHFISVIDRDSVDEVLALSWNEFNRRYRWRKHSSQWSSPGQFLQEFAYEPSPDQATVDDIMDRRTLRWTMNRCSPKVFFMHEIITHVPHLEARDRSYWPQSLFELCIVQAVGVEAFVRRDISEATLYSIVRFTECFTPDDVLDLSHHNKKIVKALQCGYWTPSLPLFRWLSTDAGEGGYHYLNIRETTTVVRFLQRAWEGNWPGPHLAEHIRKQLGEDLGISDSVDPTIRDSGASREILSWFRSPKSTGLCLVNHYGSP